MFHSCWFGLDEQSNCCIADFIYEMNTDICAKPKLTEWDPAQYSSSVCVIGVSCGPPHPLENGLIQGTDFHAGSSVVYQCNIGFYLLGDAKVHCTNSGKWGGNPPACLGTLLHYTVDQFLKSKSCLKDTTTYLLCISVCAFVSVFRCGWVCSGIWLWRTRQLSEHRGLLHLHLYSPVQWRRQKLHR